jgi:hypothetical protein
MNPDCDPLEQNARARLIDDLARIDGRRDRSHPFYGKYTGLARPMTRIIQLEAEMLDLKHQVAMLCDRLAAASDALAGCPPPEFAACPAATEESSATDG